VAIFAVGDVHGCFSTFKRLLRRLTSESQFRLGQDQLWLTGDLINRGPDSLGMLRWVIEHQTSIQTVMGNHELQLLARIAELVPPGPHDTLDPILAAPDRTDLVNWIKALPFVQVEGPYTMVHAGLWPTWEINDLKRLAKECADLLQTDSWISVIDRWRNSQPTGWNESLTGPDRLATLMAIMTGIRTVATSPLRLNNRYKGGLTRLPEGVIPWHREGVWKTTPNLLITGHWAQQGLLLTPQLVGLDTGCAHHGLLTAIRLPDRALFQEPFGEQTVHDS